jgi:LysM repeat protein
MWTKSACVVLAWSILVILTAVGIKGSVRPAPASIRIASSTEVALSRPLSGPAAPAASPAARYIVQPGDTLSGIAAALAVRGGWPALYAANRPLIGPDPNVLYSGTVLVLPGRRAAVRYTVEAGDTLSGIAAALAVRGGWPGLYAANWRVIGADPNTIRAGTVLAIPGAAPSVPTSLPRSSPAPAPAPKSAPKSAPPGSRHPPGPALAGAAPAVGMPRWLTTMLVAVGLLIAGAFLTEPVLALARRQRADSRAARPPVPRSGPRPAPEQLTAPKARIVVTDFDRLVVTYSTDDGTVCVLRPPGTDPRATLRVARVVLPEEPYRELAGNLGLPASWPIVMADHDRVVVTRSQRDDTVYVLRPPGADPRAILRAARLVLPEEPYEDLADQLGVCSGLVEDGAAGAL